MALPYTALLTIENVLEENLGGVALDSLNGDLHLAIEGVIKGVTGRIEGYLDRSLVVRAAAQRIAAHEWARLDGDDQGRFFVWAESYPVVEVATADPVLTAEAFERKPGRLLVAAAPVSVQVDYFAGYRREDYAALAELKTAAGGALDELTVLPEVLPYEIAEVALEMCLYRLSRRLSGFFAPVTSRTEGERKVSFSDKETPERTLLQRLVSHKRLA